MASSKTHVRTAVGFNGLQGTAYMYLLCFFIIKRFFLTGIAIVHSAAEPRQSGIAMHSNLREIEVYAQGRDPDGRSLS